MFFYQEDTDLFCLSGLIKSPRVFTRLFQCGRKTTLDSEVAEYENDLGFTSRLVFLNLVCTVVSPGEF